MKNKKGFLRILEAFIAIMLLIGTFAYLNSKRIKPVDMESEIHDIQRNLFNEIADDEMLRYAVMKQDSCAVEHLVYKRIPKFLAFAINICKPLEKCNFPGESPRANIYSDDVMIATSLFLTPKEAKDSEISSSKILKMFVWEGTPAVPAECPVKEYNCSNGVIEPPEQCDVVLPEGTTCASLGYASGTSLSCTSSCFFDTSDCGAAAPVPTCTPSWTYGSWSVCQNIGGWQQTRIATDSNNCGTTSGREAISRTSVSQGYAGCNQPSGCSCGVEEGAGSIVCTDGFDNDGDTSTDDADSGC